MPEPKDKISSIEMFRVLAILAVICLHTRPFYQVPGKEPVFYMIRMLCRFAVPFFFIVSGYFFGKKIKQGASPVRLFFRISWKLGLLYAFWTFTYLFLSFLGFRTAADVGFFPMIFEAFRGTAAILNDWRLHHWDLLFLQGWASPLYPLWFIPAMICGFAILTFFIAIRQEKWLAPVAAFLFFLATPYCHLSGISFDFNARNGPFFSTLFLGFGYWQAQRQGRPSLFFAVKLTAAGLILQAAEFYWLHARFHYPPDFDFTFATIIYGAGFFALALARPEWGKHGVWQSWGGLTQAVFLNHMLFADKIFNFGHGWLDRLPYSWWPLREFALIPIVYFASLALGAAGRKGALKKSIAFYCIGNATTPSTRFRVLPLVQYFKQEGWKVAYYSLPNAAGGRLGRLLGTFWQGIVRFFQLLQAPRFEVLVIQKGLTPWRSRWLLHYFLGRKRPYIYDYDDAIYAKVPVLLPPSLRWLQDTEAPVKFMRKASIVVGGNQYLANYAKDLGLKNAVVPTPIDTDEYQPVPAPSNPVVIGWSGSTGTNFYVNIILPVLQRLGEKHRFCFLVISNDLRDIALPQEPSFEFKFIPWREESVVEDLQKITIGLMPLTDDETARGKCGLKALQYMALGLPVAVSPVGVNCEIIEHGKNGFLASTEEEWFAALDSLLARPELRESVGRAARRTVEEKYSVHACAPLFAALAEDVSRL